MAREVHIVVIFDTNSHSGNSENDYHFLRNSINYPDQKGKKHIQQEMQQLLDMTGESPPDMHFIVEQWDTAQLYHEKNSFFMPQLADGYQEGSIGRESLRKSFVEGHYHVLPPLYGEEAYYDAVAKFVRVFPLEETEEKRLERWAEKDVIEKAESIQPLFIKYVKAVPQSYRKGDNEEAFEAYRRARFNTGEVTVRNFLKEFRPDPQAETVFVFVSRDKGAIKDIHNTFRHGNNKAEFRVFTTVPEEFLGFMAAVKQKITEKYTVPRIFPSAKGDGTIYPRNPIDFALKRGNPPSITGR